MQGAYVLLIEFTKSSDIPIGKRVISHFEVGYYAYVGSALIGLENRIKRHLRREKKLHWHIDYLLKEANVRQVVYAETDKKQECPIAKKLLKILKPIRGFGCSDCKCEAHLYYHKDLKTLRETVLKGFMALNLKLVVITADQFSSRALSSRSNNVESAA